MAVTNKLLGLFRNRLSRDLADAAARTRAIQEVVASAAESRSRGEAEWSANLEALEAALEEAGVDLQELYAATVQALPEELAWGEKHMRLLLKQPHLAADQMPVLERAAAAAKTNISWWRRLFEERRRQKNHYLVAASADLFLMTVGRFFPAPGQSEWLDNETEGEARALFQETLAAALDRIEGMPRADEPAQRILELGLAHHPEREASLTVALAECHRLARRTDSRATEVALLACLHRPGNTELKRWAASLLLASPQMESQGIELLLQLYEENPEDEGIIGDLGQALRRQTKLSDREFPALRRWFKVNSGDTTAAELLADYHAVNEDMDEDALNAYRLASRKSPNRAFYLRLLGRAHATKGNWTEVIDVLDGLRARGEDGEDIVIPLATAYAETGRNDADAIGYYARAVKLGARNQLIHDQYCRYLYSHKRDDPQSVEQFKATLAIHPDCAWARLGNIRHLVSSQDFNRALEEACRHLSAQPGDLELASLAGDALAGSSSRPQIRRLESLPDRVRVTIFEKALQQRPELTALQEPLVRCRLRLGMRDQETSRLLGELCRRDPDAIDLRIARADTMWGLGQRDNAIAVYRALLDRWMAGGFESSTGPHSAPSERQRILLLVAEHLLSLGPKPEDTELLLEAASLPQAPAGLVIGAADVLIQNQMPHPMRLAILERATSVAPEDERLEIAVAEARASRGNPRPAIRLALRQITRRIYDESTINLLHAAVQVARRDQIGNDLVSEMRALKDRTDLPERLLLVLAEALSNTQCWTADCVGLYKRAIAMDPQQPRLLGSLARSLEAAGEDSQAAEYYRRVVEMLPDDDEMVLRLSRTHIRLRMASPELLAIAERACAIAPGDGDLSLHLARILLEAGNVQPAIQHIDRLLRDHPELSPELLTLLEHSSRMSTNQGNLLILLARVYTKVGRIEQALATLARLQRQYQRYVGELIQCYEDIIAAAPENARARIERGILWRLIGQVEEAAEDLRIACELSPGNTSTLAEYADVEVQRLTRGKINDPEAWARVAGVWIQLDEPDEAMAAVNQALLNNPACRTALLHKARIELNIRELDAARATLHRLERSDEPVLAMLQELARHYEDKGEHLAAVEVLTDALDVPSEQRRVIERLRSLHEQQARASVGDQERKSVLRELSQRAQNRYELREEIGRGAMGLVYLAYDRELDEQVVLKILPEHFAENPDAVSRFRLEAKAARKLSHPNIVRIHDIGEEGGRKHLSMEYVGGGDLKAHIARCGGALSQGEAVRIAREIARALFHAHSEGVLHRDIKPANILLSTNGRVKLSDFGIAAIVDLGKVTGEAPSALAVDRASQSDSLAGTPLYMSPEQFRGEPLGPTSDLYSLGVLLYEMLTGAPPFKKGSVSYHHQYTIPPPLPPTIQESLREVVMKLLMKAPTERFQSAHEVLSALDRCGAGGSLRNRTGLPDEWIETPRLDSQLIDPGETGSIGGASGTRNPDQESRTLLSEDFETPLLSDLPQPPEPRE